VIYFLYIMFKCVVGLSSTILVMYVCGETYPMTPMPVWVRIYSVHCATWKADV